MSLDADCKVAQPLVPERIIAVRTVLVIVAKERYHENISSVKAR
jgi:hypothetical protein